MTPRAMAEKPDPFDIEALERSLNDSATRVSTIWVSFLIFSLYLLIAAGTVEHRQLFLAEPVKLPALNIDLPLWWFFVLAPILFVIFHSYVLLQVLLLGRTAAAYNDAIEKTDFLPAENASLRQRLANTLFAQIFAGSPREREGWLGFLLRAMAWITLAVFPILILVAFQFAFLPYHSHIATWTHRLLILVELGAFFLMWPLALDARRDFEWPDVWGRLKRVGALPRQLFGPKDGRRNEWRWLCAQAAPMAACLLFIFFSLSLATFPGEPHLNWFTGQAPWSVQCERWIYQRFAFADLQFDRLIVPNVDVVDDEKLARISNATADRRLYAWQGERTRNFRNRDLNCSNLANADLRRVDLTNAQMQGAILSAADLMGASLRATNLRNAALDRTLLQEADLGHAQLQGTSLEAAQLQGASLEAAQLQGSVLSNAELQGASLVGAQLHGSYLKQTKLHGAYLYRAQLQGAELISVELQGASLEAAHLQGVMVDIANIPPPGVRVRGALWAAIFPISDLTLTLFAKAFVWRARMVDCTEANLTDVNSDPVIELTKTAEGRSELLEATTETINRFVERVVAEVPDRRKDEVRERMRENLVDSLAKDGRLGTELSNCQTSAMRISREEQDRKHAALLGGLVCDAPSNRKAIANGVIRNWLIVRRNFRDFSADLAKHLLGDAATGCPATKDLDEPTKDLLRTLVSAPIPYREDFLGLPIPFPADAH